MDKGMKETVPSGLELSDRYLNFIGVGREAG